MPKMTAENWWLKIDTDEYKIQDGSTVTLPFDVRYIKQRGSGDMGPVHKPVGLVDDIDMTMTLLIDESEKAALDALHGTAIADILVIDKTGGSDTTIVQANVYFNAIFEGTVGDNVVCNVTLKVQGLPTIPDLSHLDTSA